LCWVLDWVTYVNILIMKVYLSGKVTGLDSRETVKKFGDYENRLKALGYAVANPVAEISPLARWDVAMKKAIVIMMECDAIFLIEDWLQSRGAKIEFELSHELGYSIMTPDDLERMEHKS